MFQDMSHTHTHTSLSYVACIGLEKIMLKTKKHMNLAGYPAGYPVSGLAGYPAGYPVPLPDYPAGYRMAKKAGYPAGYPASRISGTSLVILYLGNDPTLSCL